MTIADLEREGLILLKCRSGSHAYGLATEASDEDFRGVFYAPKRAFYASDYPAQVSDATNDVVYYELGRFLELLGKANPTALELLATAGEHVLYRHPVMTSLRVEDFLTKACKDTFTGYAITQIRKARGLNKKVHNPYPKARKRVEEFCYVITEGQSRPLPRWAAAQGFSVDALALVAVAHARGVYAVYHDPIGRWARGISSGPLANQVNLSSVPKGERCLAYLAFNKDGYSVYCRNHREYWAWVEDRNDVRYEGTLAHGQGYDAKNMMHTLRLLDMAEEIFRVGQLNVLRPDRDFLLRVKRGAFTLDEVLEMAEQRLDAIERWAARASLPVSIPPGRIEEKLYLTAPGAVRITPARIIPG